MINFINRVVAVLVWLAFLIGLSLLAVVPLRSLNWVVDMLGGVEAQLATWQSEDATNFLIGQVAAGVLVILVFGSLLWLEIWPKRRRGVRLQTVEGGSVELDTASIGRRLEWHLDQLADVITVVPQVKARGSAVDIQLEVETAPNVDVPMKTDEVVEVTRDIVEQDMGLKLGRLDVRMRHAPFEEEWMA